MASRTSCIHPSNAHHILYVHIPKTAGRAFHAMMAEEFGLDRVFKLGLQNDKSTKSVADLIALSAAQQNTYNMYIGHLPHGLQEHLSSVTMQLTCLRDPVARILSLRKYNQKIGLAMPEMKSWLSEDFEASNGMVKRFLGLHLEDGKYFDFRKNKTFHGNITLTEGDLFEAIEIIEQNYPLVMLMERFSESLVLLQRRLNSGPLFSIWHNYRNQTGYVPGYQETSQEMLDYIMEVNELDIRLYNHFAQKFAQMISSQDNEFQEELRIHRKITQILKHQQGNTLSVEEFQLKINNLVTNAMAGKDISDTATILNMFAEKLKESVGFQQFNEKFQAHFTTMMAS